MTQMIQNVSSHSPEFYFDSLVLPIYAHVCLCTDTTMTVNTGSWRSSAAAETTGWTQRITRTQTSAPTATTQTGSRSRGPRPVGPAPPETNAHRTTRARPWATAHLSTTHQTTRAHPNRSGAAARHNRSCVGLLPAAIDSANALQGLLTPTWSCSKHCVSVSSAWLSSPRFSSSREPGRWTLGRGSNQVADLKNNNKKNNQSIFLYLRVESCIVV